MIEKYENLDLESLSTEELNELLQVCDREISYFDTFQMALKILMNSLYGALANKYFPLFNDKMAQAITGNGRYFIRGLSEHLNKKFLRALGEKNKNYIIYNDTDSGYFTVNEFVQKFKEKNPQATISECVDFCQGLEDKLINPTVQEFIDSYAQELNARDKSLIGAGREVISDCVAPSTLIRVKIGNKPPQTIKISNLAKMFGINTLTKNNEIAEVQNVEILSYNENTNSFELKPILNVQKKVTTKRMLTLTSPNGKSITVTEDHLIAVKGDEGVFYKEAKNITLEDDVMMFDNTYYSKENCKIYGVEYINHGSRNCDLVARGRSIQESRNRNFKIRSEIKLKSFIARIKQIEAKHHNNWVELFRKFMYSRRCTRIKTIEKIIKFIDEHHLFVGLDRNILRELIRTNKREDFNKFITKQKYGETYYKKLQRSQSQVNRFKKFENRVTVIQRKLRRAEGKTPLHTAKRKYRMKSQE